MNSFERFEETSLPPQEEFYSRLSGKGITEKEYEHAQKVWKKFGCHTLGEYHDLYLQTDAVLLAEYGLDPVHTTT